MSQTLNDRIKALQDLGLTAEQVLGAIAVVGSGETKQINTTTSIRDKRFTVDLKSMVNRLGAELKREEKAPVIIAKPYGAYVGGWVKVSLNGVGIELPADGKEYKVPKTIAALFKQRLANLDAMNSETGFNLKSENVSPEFALGGLKSSGLREELKAIKVGTRKYGD